MHFIKHFITITKHRHKVLVYCFRCSLYRQGLVHDLSKYSFTEFIPGAKYCTGSRSPIYFERQDKGYSLAWLHHKGRNKHHPEYWIDMNKDTRIYEPIIMPDRYIAESFCDRLAASKTYNKKNFQTIMVKEYFERERNTLPMHSVTREKLSMLIDMYIEKGEKATFKFIKNNMRNNRKKENNEK